MPPYISQDDNEGFHKPFSILHPGIGKVTFQEPQHQSHVFQQSVTLTASMWNEKDSKENMESWSFGNWGVFAQYSPLIVGLFCGFGIVLIIMSTVMLWRYCWISATKKVCCSYGEMSPQQKYSLPPLRREKFESQNGFENFHRLEFDGKPVALQRSATLGSIPKNEIYVRNETEGKFSKLNNQDFSNTKICSNLYAEINQLEPFVSQDNLYTSHLYLQKLENNSSKMSKNLSRSTPALEDLYAKVNFSKKKRNRMRKDEAAIIAMSKSHSGQKNSSLAQFSSAIVVYNERTAL